MNNAFLKSFQVLHEVCANGAFSSIALNKTLFNCKKQDKALITKIVYGVLDNDIRLNYILSKHVKKMPKGDTLLYLKIGAYCLTELSLPVYTVVNDVAELSKLSADRRIVGFVNATLKTVAQRAKDFDDYPADELQYLSVKYSYPIWALKKLIKDYGYQTAKEIVAHSPDTRTTVRFASPVSAQQVSERYGVQAEPTLFDDAFYIKGNWTNDASDCTVQSLSSMAISRICACLTRHDGSFLDCCAAPGGKSVYVKQLRPDLTVTSCDIHPHRVELTQNYARRMGVEINAVCRDMTQPLPEWDGAFDAVLCDVPCSGFGVLDNRPDIKIFRENKDISELMKVQYAILDNCSRYVCAGGTLVYSTCTVFDNENGQNVRKFLKEHSDFAYGQIILPEVPSADKQSYYQFLPHKDGMQGFFAAVLKRVK